MTALAAPFACLKTLMDSCCCQMQSSTPHLASKALACSCNSKDSRSKRAAGNHELLQCEWSSHHLQVQLLLMPAALLLLLLLDLCGGMAIDFIRSRKATRAPGEPLAPTSLCSACMSWCLRRAKLWCRWMCTDTCLLVLLVVPQGSYGEQRHRSEMLTNHLCASNVVSSGG
jgi:hypothetical protein